MAHQVNAAGGTAPTVDVTVNVNGAGTQTTAPFSTSGAGRWVFAFVRSDGPASAASQTRDRVGCWFDLVAGAAHQRPVRDVGSVGGVRAGDVDERDRDLDAVGGRVPSGADGGRVRELVGSGGFGIDECARPDAPTVSLTTTQANSLVYAAGNDWDRAVARTVPATQTMVNQIVDTAVGDTFWAQRLTAAVASPGAVTINDTAPTNDQWNYTAVEVKGV